MPEQIGLQSTLDNSEFLAALAAYQSALDKTGKATDDLVNSYKKVDKAEAEATKQADELNSAIARLIEKERVADVMDKAAKAFASMTPAEKAAAAEAYNLQKAQEAAAVATQEKAKVAVAAAQKEADAAKKVADNAKKVAEEQEKQNTTGKKLYGMYTELNSALSLVKQGMAAVGQIIDATIGSFMRQAEEVRSLSLATGASYDATSRLIQVFDDAGVDASQLRAAMLALKNQGIAPSIDSIATLADQYRAIQDPNEKVIFLTKNLGSRGVELGKIFDMTGEQIRQAGKDVSDSLVFDEKKIALAEKARIAQDNWNDTLKGFGNNIAMFVLPGLTDFIGGTELLIDAIIKADKKILDNAVAMGTLRNRDIDAAEAAKLNAKAIAAGNAALGDRYDSALKAAEGEEALTGDVWDSAEAGRYERDMFVVLTTATKHYKDEANRLATVQIALAAGLSGPLKSAYAGYTSSMAALTGKQADLMLQMQTLLNQGYSPESKAVLDLQRQYNSLNGEMLSAEEAFKLTTAQMIYQQAAAGLDADAALDLARAMGLVSESDYNLATAISTLKQMREAGTISDAQYTQGILAMTEAAMDGNVELSETNAILDMLTGKTVTPTVNLQDDATEPLDAIVDKLDGINGKVYHPTIDVGLTGPGAGWNPPGGGGGAPIANATGGPIGAGQPSWMGEYRPEVIIPRYATGGSPGGAMPAMVGERGPEIIIPKTDSYVYPSTNSYYQNYSNQMNMSMSGINVNNGMDVAALKAMIMQTVSEALSMRQ